MVISPYEVVRPIQKIEFQNVRNSNGMNLNSNEKVIHYKVVYLIS